MNLLSFFVLAVAAIGLLGFALVSFIFGSMVAHARARRKGYHTVGASLVIGWGAIGWLVAFVTALTVWDSLPMAYASPFFGIATMLLTVWLLPRRQVRVFGPRRGGRQLVAAGWITGFAGGIPTVLGLLIVMSPINSLPDALLVALTVICGAAVWFVPAYLMVSIGKVAKRQPTLEAVLTKDARAPVLYLRPFDSERQPFVMGEFSRYASFYRGFGWPREAVSVLIPLENYLAESIWQLVGPFVALGSPDDFIPPVSGAARRYVKDDTWQQEFDQLARSAAAIVVEVGNSANLTWEFEHIRHNGWHERLILLTRHPSWQLTKSAVAWAWLQRLMGFSKPSWAEFSSKLTRVGYDLNPTDPGPGSIVSFDANGRGIVLTTTADLPRDYTETIRAHVALIAE